MDETDVVIARVEGVTPREFRVLLTYARGATGPYSVAVEALDGKPINTETWRGVRIGEALAEGRSRRLLRLVGGSLESLTSDLGPSPQRPHCDAADRDEREAAFRARLVEVYRRGVRGHLDAARIAELVGIHFGVNSGTALRWITEARAAGLLGTHAEEAANVAALAEALSDLRSGRRRGRATTASLEAIVASSIRDAHRGLQITSAEVEKQVARAIDQAKEKRNE